MASFRWPVCIGLLPFDDGKVPHGLQVAFMHVMRFAQFALYSHRHSQKKAHQASGGLLAT